MDEPNEIKVITKFDKHEIRQMVGVESEIHSKVSHIIRLQEEGVKKALVELGWTPPPDENVSESNDVPANFQPAGGDVNAEFQRYKRAVITGAHRDNVEVEKTFSFADFHAGYRAGFWAPLRPGRGCEVPERCEVGLYGRSYDGPEKCRAYTYAEQPNNQTASVLGRIADLAVADASGDWIDRGLCLLRRLQEEGFGVFEMERIE